MIPPHVGMCMSPKDNLGPKLGGNSKKNEVNKMVV